MEIFRGYHARAKDEFVIESENKPDNGKPLSITAVAVTSWS